MEQQLLSQFFGRYPSAFASSPSGDAYQVICQECGAFVLVTLPQDMAEGIAIDCAECGAKDRLDTEVVVA